MTEEMSRAFNPNRKLGSIQALRAIAALAVVFNHSLAQITTRGAFFHDEFFAFGVDIFFVISGFIMVHISERKYTSPFSFIFERVLRIYPMYFLFTTLVSLVIILVPNSTRNSSFNILHYILSIFFIPHINPSTLSYSPILRVGWTLNLEMYFYAIFALSMMVSHKHRVAITAVIILLVVAIEVARPSGIGLIGVYSDNIVIEFVFGMVIAKLFSAYGAIWSRSLTVALAAVSICLIILASSQEIVLPRFLSWGAPSAMLVWCALMLDRTKISLSPVVTFAGDCSYSLYLSHLFVISALRILWVKLHLPVGSWTALLLFMILAAVVSCAVSAGCYKFVEEPIARALRRFRSAPQPVQATTY